MATGTTVEDLRQAYAEEMKNRAMYLAFAETAESEGKPHIARIFRALAEAELIHSRQELRLMGREASTTENVKFALSVEEREFQDLYARFLQDAEAQGDAEAAELMGRILKVERGHHQMLKNALIDLLDHDDAAPDRIFVCRECGNTVVGEQTEPCGICGAQPDSFVEIA